MHIKKEGTSETATTDPARIEKAKIDPTKGETNMTIEDMVVLDTQQPAIDWAGEWSDEELRSFQPPKDNSREDHINKDQKLTRDDGETIDWDTNFPVLQISQDDRQDPTTSGSTQAKANKLKKKYFKNNKKN